jgi:hypothetical protein
MRQFCRDCVQSQADAPLSFIAKSNGRIVAFSINVSACLLSDHMVAMLMLTSPQCMCLPLMLSVMNDSACVEQVAVIHWLPGESPGDRIITACGLSCAQRLFCLSTASSALLNCCRGGTPMPSGFHLHNQIYDSVFERWCEWKGVRRFSAGQCLHMGAYQCTRQLDSPYRHIYKY